MSKKIDKEATQRAAESGCDVVVYGEPPSLELRPLGEVIVEARDQDRKREYERGRADERAAIVAYLRNACGFINTAAEIDRGDHLKP